MSEPKLKDQSIETLRGLAILLVVAGYIINDDLTRAFHHSIEASFLRFSYFMLVPIRMPLFTVISAYLYAASPATRETFRKLVTGKARRILIPFLAVSTIQYIVMSLLPLSNNAPLREIYKIYIWPHEQLWFLFSIFQIFIIVGLIDVYRLLDTPKKWFLILVISLIPYMLLQLPKMFSIKGTVYLFPFFLLGYGIKRYPDAIFRKKTLLLGIVSVVGSMLIWASLYFYPQWPWPYLYKTVGLLVTFSCVPLIFYYRRTVPALAKIGYFAFGIHLFNRIAIAFPRAVFEYYNLHNTAAQFILYLIFGVACAIAIQLVIEKYSVTRKYILGLRK